MDNQNSDIIELLDILYGMVTEAWGVPLGNDKCIIEREKAIEIINEIKSNLPAAVAEAQRLVSARDEFIGNAKREAEALRKSAEEQAHAMIEEQEIVRVARAKSSEMISYAESKSNELRRVASEYVEQIMHETEESMKAALATMENAHSSFRAIGAAAPKPVQVQPADEDDAPKHKQHPARQAHPSPRPQTVQNNKSFPVSSKVQRIQREED